jgi:tryptophan 2,3-dioxygenase
MRREAIRLRDDVAGTRGRAVAVPPGDEGSGPLTYGSYLRVPELLALQSPRAEQPVPGEMLFIVVQQAQELWFKQILHDLGFILRDLGEYRILSAVSLLQRLVHILEVVAAEVTVLESLPPAEFRAFRHVLKTSSGFESEQFREMELASGLDDPAYLRLVGKFLDLDAVRARWPMTLHAAFLNVLGSVASDPVNALVRIYRNPEEQPEVFMLAEALAEYELRFRTWRFKHVLLVNRVIGDRAAGTGGSSGSGYLENTLHYRFFPELWEARNRLSAGT